MPQSQDNAIVIALLQSIVGKVDNVADKVDDMATRVAVIESRKTDEKVEALRVTVDEKVAALTKVADDNSTRLTKIETEKKTMSPIISGVISVFASIAMMVLAKLLDFIK